MTNETNLNAAAQRYAEAVAAHAKARNASAVATYHLSRTEKALDAAREALLDATERLVPPVGPAVFGETAAQ